MGREAGWVGGGGEAAGGVHLPLSRLVMGELPTPFRELLRRPPARARLLRFRFRLCGAAQRYPRLFWTAPSAPRSSSSATLSGWPVPAASCSGVALHGRRRRRLGRRTQRPIRRERKRRTPSWSWRSRRRRHRRAVGRFGDRRGPPHSAARCRHGCARRGRGAGVGPTGVPQYPTGTRKTKQQARPEGRLCCRFG